MCGIAGFLGGGRQHSGQDDARRRLAAMAAMIAHRGPDDQDALFEAPVGLAHRRLAVIDPAPHGRQPMRRGPLTIVYNGEIYNFRELRRTLESEGESFRTSTDTEILLAAFSRWGESALDRINGMFAFAIWDADRRRLTLARDRAGKKPLYYAHCGDALLFGSEIKALFAWPEMRREPDYEAIHHYLSFQYVPSPMTAFAGVSALPPASVMVAEPGKEPSISRYWSAPSPSSATRAADPRALEEELRDLLSAAVRRRMVADVPIGALLSGGVDSSAVAAFMAAANDRPIKTYSIGFDEPDHDERSFARAVANLVGSDHTEEVVRPDAVALLPEIVWHYGQPFADPSAVPTYCVARLARRDVTVVLTGDGGDEFFLGYNRYNECGRRAAATSRLPAPLRELAAAAAAAIPDALVQHRPFGGLRRRLRHFGAAHSALYEPAMMYFSEDEKRRHYGPALRPQLAHSSLGLLDPYFAASPSIEAGASWADIHTYLPDDILVKVDVATMAFGLEARAPFLDVEVMEWASRLPWSVRMRGGRLKGLLKDALRPILPAAVLDRPKMGFGAPIERWFRSDFEGFARDTLCSPKAETRGFFEPGFAKRLINQHVQDGRHYHTRLWALLMLELWMTEWIDPPAARLIEKNANIIS